MLHYMSQLLKTTKAPSPLHILSEAAADKDEQYYRILGKNSDNMHQISRERMIKTANHLYEYNALAKQIIDLPISFLFAEGVKISADNAKARAVIQQFWQDDSNNLEYNIADYIKHLFLTGELCLAAYSNQYRMRIALIPSNYITHVEADPENCNLPNLIYVRHNPNDTSEKIYKVIECDDNLSDSAHKKRSNIDNSCFYFSVNKIFPHIRGKSQLLPLADMIDAYQKFIMGEMQRAKAMRWFAWHRKVKNITKEQLQNLQGTMPSPGSVLTTNEGEEWTPLTVNLGGQDSQNFGKIFRNFTLGGAGLPVHWFGGAEDVNRATAVEMNAPIYKQLTMHQRQCTYILKKITTAVLQLNNVHGNITIDWPELATQDIQSHTQSLQQATNAIQTQIQTGLLTPKTAMRILASIAERLGVEYNIDAEIAALKTNNKKQTKGA